MNDEKESGRRPMIQRGKSARLPPGVCDGAAKRDMEMKMTQQFRARAQDPQTRESLFGAPITEFVLRNRLRAHQGIEPITREDIPPGVNWDIPLKNRAERVKCFCKIVGGSSPGDEAEENAAEPPPAPHRPADAATQDALPEMFEL